MDRVVFKNWTVEKCIGEGAFGKVYKIYREEFGHRYEAALKVMDIPQSKAELDVIRNDCRTEEEVEQYFQSVVEDIVEEFTLMSKLKGNSNIVGYEDHDVVKKEDEFGWRVCIRMELLTGIYDYYREHKIMTTDIIQLGIDLCNALELCQKYKIIHRDIKPENIFISDVGTYKLGDFGVAREFEKTSGALSKKGTRHYMAPEVYKGLPYSANVDIYSLGIVLYRFLNNNRLPYLPAFPEPIKYSDKETAELLRMSGQPMQAPKGAGKELAAVVLKACAYLPTERYQSAKEMRIDLERILNKMQQLELRQGQTNTQSGNLCVENTAQVSRTQEEETEKISAKEMASSDLEETQTNCEIEMFLYKKKEEEAGWKTQIQELQVDTIAVEDKEKKSNRWAWLVGIISVLSLVVVGVVVSIGISGVLKQAEQTRRLDEALAGKTTISAGSIVASQEAEQVQTATPGVSPTQYEKTASPNPTERPTANPTKRPTTNPTDRPTANPTKRPTANPTRRPTSNPTKKPAKDEKGFKIENNDTFNDR